MRDNLGNPVWSGKPEFARGVLALDDCEGTFTYENSGTGGDDVHEYATAAAFTGLRGLRMKTRTTSAAADDTLACYKWIGMPESGLIVIRAKIALVAVAPVKSIGIDIRPNNGARQYLATLKSSPNTPKVEYRTTAGAFVEIATMAYNSLALAFIDYEIVIDCRTMTYLSVAWNGIRADLKTIPLENVGAVAARQAAFGIDLYAIGAAPAEVYLDNIYIGEYLDI